MRQKYGFFSCTCGTDSAWRWFSNSFRIPSQLASSIDSHNRLHAKQRLENSLRGAQRRQKSKNRVSILLNFVRPSDRLRLARNARIFNNYVVDGRTDFFVNFLLVLFFYRFLSKAQRSATPYAFIAFFRNPVQRYGFSTKHIARDDGSCGGIGYYTAQ